MPSLDGDDGVLSDISADVNGASALVRDSIQDETGRILLNTPASANTETLLREWVQREYMDPRTPRKITGKQILIECLYGVDSPWKKLQEHALLLKKTPMKKFAQTLMLHKGSFYYYMKKSGHASRSFADLCLWLGAIGEGEREKMDENGFLNTQGLQSWCHHGYMDRLGYHRIYGKHLLRKFYISGIFWKQMEEYQHTMDSQIIESVGGKFPGSMASFASRIKGKDTQKRIITIQEIFDFFEVPLPEKKVRRTSRYRYLPPKDLKHWIHTTASFYTDHGDHKVIVSGKEIFLRAFLSKDGFWSAIEPELQGLPERVLAQINGNIPHKDIYYRKHMTKDGFTEVNPKNILLWLGVINEEQASRVNTRGFLSMSGFKRWCHTGYISPETGERIYGKDILREAYTSGHFWKKFAAYVDSLDPETIRSIGGKIPKSDESLMSRITDTRSDYRSIEEIFYALGVSLP